MAKTQMSTLRNPDTVHTPLGAYSHQVEIPAGARWLAIAGQVGAGKNGKVSQEPAEQARQCLENIRRNLEAAGMEVRDIVKLNWYVVGSIDAQRRRELLTEFLGDHRPASTLVYVAGLASPDYKVEIEAWACKA
jgi:enamine deaminase RidA (YjgF/YER057c/UK114 family)